MKCSADRILSTHPGSLPRPRELLDRLADRDKGVLFEQKLLQPIIDDVVRRQAELGIDVVADGEMSKASFVSYMNERLTGLEPDKPRPGVWANSKEARDFPDFYGTAASIGLTRGICTGPIRYRGHALLQIDIDNLRTALAGLQVEEAFIPSISPSNVATFNRNEYYPSEEAFLFAIADALNEEYKAIVDAGFVLQVDDPALVTYYVTSPDITVADARKWAALRVEVLNHALRGIPEDRVRFHTCYSINMGPRVHDMELRDIIDLILAIKAGAYSFEYGNPRHEHEAEVWKAAKVPEDKLLLPGVVTNSTVLVEHPELIAARIVRFADIVGRERVIASADCGFASAAHSKDFVPSVAWAKLKALGEGTRLASKQLWKH